mmetsp:Transcript_61439/g.99469  ORF Transcript_61439/g.99469 Transcript_61439/m.99469 type:complete len:225 (+) Transcript_61439:76-750(+)
MNSGPEGSWRRGDCQQCGASCWAPFQAAATSQCWKCSHSGVTAEAGRAMAVNSLQLLHQELQLRIEASPGSLQANQREAASERRLAMQWRDLWPEDYEVLIELETEAAVEPHEIVLTAFAENVQTQAEDRNQQLAGSWRRDPRSNSWTLARARTVRAADVARLQVPSTTSWCGGTCAICLEDFEIARDLRTLPCCGHVFHAACLEQWLTRGRAVCPLDNFDVFA